MNTRQIALLSMFVSGALGLWLGAASGPALAASPPAISNVSFSNVGSSSATLTAQINPDGIGTSFRFEYGTSASYGQSVPSPEGSAGAGSTLAPVQVLVQGLVPDTLYHFQLVASNIDGSTFSGDITFSTLPTGILGLPDGRGYEMVSSTVNADGNVYEPHGVINGGAGAGDNTILPYQAAADGHAVTYPGDPSTTSGTGSEGTGTGNQYLAIRSPDNGWSATNIEPSSGSTEETPIFQGFSSDLSAGILDWNGQQPLVAEAPAGGYNVLYQRTSHDGSLHPLFTTSPPNRAVGEFGAYEILHYGEGTRPVFAGGSSSFEHLLFIANDKLIPNALDGGAEENNLYDSVDSRPSLVNVLPDGTPAPNAIFGSPVVRPEEEAQGHSSDFSHVISEDGSHIFWTDLNTGNIYVRENDTKTVQVDASVGGGGRFWTASADGSEVFFTKSGDLYRYDVGGGRTTDLTPGAEVQGVPGVSDDGSYVYFVANAALAPGAAQQKCDPESGNSGCNLYLLHEGEPVKFIAALSGRDDGGEPSPQVNINYGDWRPGLGNREAEVTPDGRHLIFVSQRNLTGYQSNGRSEVYVYSAEGEQLSCASCRQSGEAPSSHPLLTAGLLRPSYSNTYLPRWISADGSRAFFDSMEALVPQDTDGTLDVYEWERNGAGGCQKDSGCVYLLSGGTSTDNSFFADASTSGDDVFIVTRAQLVQQDQNETFDMYDARVDASRPPTPPRCTGSGCQGVPFAPPIFATPSSVTFSGVGNFVVQTKTATKVKKRVKLKKKHKKTRKKRINTNRPAVRSTKHHNKRGR